MYINTQQYNQRKKYTLSCSTLALKSKVHTLQMVLFCNLITAYYAPK